MKKLFMLTAMAMAFTFVGAATWAQMSPGPTGGPVGQRPPMGAEQRLQMMTKQLNLTPEQQQKIKPLLESEGQQMQAVHADTSLTQEARVAKVTGIRRSTNEQIKPLLDADQQQKFEEMMSRRQAAHRGGPGQAPPAESTRPPQ